MAVSSYNDPITPRRGNSRYAFKRTYCTWCGRLKWVALEGYCGACAEDEHRISVENTNRIARLRAERKK